EPLLVLLFNQEFALLFLFAFPCMLVGLIWKNWLKEKKEVFIYFSLLFILWFIFISYLAPVRQLPRYYGTSALAACILVAIICARIYDNRRIVAILILLALVSCNLLGIYLSNRNPLYGERRLMEALQKYDEPVYTDLATARRAMFFLQMEDKTVYPLPAEDVPENTLYFYNPNRVLNDYKTKDVAKKYMPLSSWEKIETIEGQSRIIVGILLEKLRLKEHIPDWLFDKLIASQEPVSLYRVGEKYFFGSTSSNEQENHTEKPPV
ncbi:MAG: hypothetical protein JRE64_16095, partial [Deltaproteobacteria bacterium]|nr:hypothetical protein [Deltaproteobacteria bacterium]